MIEAQFSQLYFVQRGLPAIAGLLVYNTKRTQLINI